MTSFHCLQVTFIRSCGKYSPSNFDVKTLNALTHRAKAVCSNPQLLTEELNHLEGALSKCKYPRWAFQKVLKDQQSKKNKKKERNTPIQKRCHIVVPYTKGLCESYKSICSKYGVQAYCEEETH